jgi:hypothetical protein
MFNNTHESTSYRASLRPNSDFASISVHRRDTYGRSEESNHRYGSRHGNDRRYRSAVFTAARDQLGASYHREAVADVVDVATGYARSREGLRGRDGRFRPIVVIAVRGVAGGDCDDGEAVSLLEVLEPFFHII